MQDFRSLRVWEVAHRLTLAVYQVTRSFPTDERYGLVTQLRRASASVGANVAEGCGRASTADTRRCCHQALGSACEVLNHALLARDLGLLDDRGFRAIESDAVLVRRMLIRLIQRMDARIRGERAGKSVSGKSVSGKSVSGKSVSGNGVMRDAGCVMRDG